jgi:hypothetical protein
MDGEWMAFYKYKLAAFYAHAEGVEMPNQPEKLKEVDTPEILFGGRLLEKFQLDLKRNPERARSIAYSILQSKGGMFRPGEKEKSKVGRETFQALTTERIQKTYRLNGIQLVNWEEQEDMDFEIETVLNRQTAEKQLRRITREIFQGKTFGIEDIIEPTFPSTKANYNKSRSGGGVVGAIFEHPEILQGLKTDEDLVKISLRTLGGEPILEVHDEQLIDRCLVLFERSLKIALEEERTNNVELVTLSEALKVRVISKHPPMTQFCLKYFQKWAHRILRNHPTCLLIGEEISAEILKTQIGNLREGEKFCSGDYKSATNEIYSWVSEVIADELCKTVEFPEGFRELFLRSLTGHMIDDPDGGPSKPQKNGQLMGAVISFIFLCIANITICTWAREISVGRNLTAATAKISINGDDNLSRLNQRGYHAWKEICSYFGLKSSVGKTFYSERFCNMNSTRFLYDPKQQIYVHQPHINLAIVKGIKRSVGGSKMEYCSLKQDWGTLQSMGANATYAVTSCDPQDASRVYKMYLKLNWDKLSEARIPWFLPEHLGGLGLPIGYGKQPSKQDLKTAAVIYNNPERFPIPKKSGMKTAWKTWQYAQSRLPVFPKVNYSTEFTTEKSGKHFVDEETIMGRLCMEAIFRLKHIKQLLDTKESHSHKLRDMENIWKKASRCNLVSKTEELDIMNLPTRERAIKLPPILGKHGKYYIIEPAENPKRILATFGTYRPQKDDTDLWED